MLLTSGELDHTLGLLMLREADALTVHATAPVREALASAFPVGPIIAPYAAVDWHTVEPEVGFKLADGLLVTAVPLSGKRPRYAAELADHPAWTVAYRFTDPSSGGTLVYAPCLAEWTPAFSAALTGADVVILDGTFWDDGEMSRAAAPGAPPAAWATWPSPTPSPAGRAPRPPVPVHAPQQHQPAGAYG